MFKGQRSYLRYLLYFWLTFGFGLVAFAGLLVAVSYDKFGELPDFEELENPKSSLASEVYSSDNVLLGKYFYKENRSNATFEELSPNLINALVATEDIRFNEHSGIDPFALMRVLVKTVILQQGAGGGSTVTQQLAKNLFHAKPSSTLARIMQKFKEWIIAAKLEKSYTKNEIIKNYLNTVPFSGHSFGIKSASREFFNTSTDSLKVEEAATLIGMLKATGRYNPVRNHDKSKQRRNIVLSQMAKYGFLDQEEADSLKQLPITLDYQSSDHNEGLAPYFREFLRGELKRFCRDNGYDLYRDGLKIYTSIDSRMQQHAEEVTREHLTELQGEFYKHWKGRGDPWGKNLKYLRRDMKNSPRYKILADSGIIKDSIVAIFNRPIPMKVFTWQGEKDTLMSPWDSLRHYKYHLQAGFMVMDPETGYIKVWVGGANYKYFKYDHINSQRQSGSTFKPFIYSVAIHEGWSPCTKLPNTPVTFEKGGDWQLPEEWTPRNADNAFEGEMVTLQTALAHSINIIAARIIREVSIQQILRWVKAMGIKSEVPPVPSICLGTPDVSVFEMVGAYGTFVNKGFYIEPTFIMRIEDKNGNIISAFVPENTEVMDEQTAYIMTKMLQNVVNHGTARRIRFRHNLEGEIAGKTGTTQEHADGWYMGFTPELVGGVWVGGDDRLVRFRSITWGQGASMALPIWGKFFERIYADSTLPYSSKATFDKPSEPIRIEMDCSKYVQGESGKQFKYENLYEGI